MPRLPTGLALRPNQRALHLFLFLQDRVLLIRGVSVPGTPRSRVPALLTHTTSHFSAGQCAPAPLRPCTPTPMHLPGFPGPLLHIISPLEKPVARIGFSKANASLVRSDSLFTRNSLSRHLLTLRSTTKPPPQQLGHSPFSAAFPHCFGWDLDRSLGRLQGVPVLTHWSGTLERPGPISP